MENIKNKGVFNASIKILGFDPKSPKEDIFRVQMTPEMARYILDYHNKHNRKFVPAQKNTIENSVREHGWRHTGDTCAFDVTGNLTEFQHRLQTIAEGKETVTVWVSTGVQKDTFEKAAPAKNRTKFDVIWRYEKSSNKDQVTTLEQLLKWRRGKYAQAGGPSKLKPEVLDMTNALALYRVWKPFILVGMNITSTFFDDKKVERFDPWRRSFNALASLMVFEGKGKVVENFLELLKIHYTTQNKKQLFIGMDEYFRSEVVAYLTGTKKTEQMQYILCRAMDRFLDAPDGSANFDFDYADANHGKMLAKSPTYRSFLKNPQGIS